MSIVVDFYQSIVDVILLGKRTPVPTPTILTDASRSLTSYLEDVIPFPYRRFVDVSKPSFALALIATILPPLVWNIIGPLEYYTHAISTVVRKPIFGVYLSAIIVATLSVFRSAMFAIAMREQPVWDDLDDPVIHAVSGAAFVMGLTFFIGAYYRLRITGTYLGDYFGILRDERITKFPFSVLDNPMYDGSSIFHFAEAVLHHSPAGMILAAWLFICYRLGCFIEEPFTAKMYAERDRKRESARLQKLMASKTS